MKENFSIVREDQFIEATRDSGYKGTDSALSELIDNSIQAMANSVAIKFTSEEQEQNGKGRPKQPRVVDVAIGDNGRGMDGNTLRKSLRFGDGTRFGDRTGIGRFGMGLPNASVSQCKRVEVYSWQRGSIPLHTYIDVEEISSGQLKEVPEPLPKTVPDAFSDLVTGPSGTLVIWKNCDRLDQDGKLDALTRSVKHSLGRMFRYYLVGEFELTIDGSSIGPFDPLYLMPESRNDEEILAMQHGDVITVEVPIPGQVDQTSTVHVTLSLLPEKWQNDFNKDKKERTARHIDSSAGFSMVRHGREIDVIKSPYHAKHWTDAWYRVEIRFEPELDEVFCVTHTKQHARIAKGTSIYERLNSLIVPNVQTLKAMIISRGKKAHQNRPYLAETTAQRVLPRLKPIEEFETKNTTQIKSEISEFVEMQRAKGMSDESAKNLETRLAQYEMIIESESLPGAPFYRTKVVGSSIVVLLNRDHLFYERVYRRLEHDAPIAKSGVELFLMTLARAEMLGSEECRDWYEDQRQEWSQHMKIFLSNVDEVDPDEELPSENDVA